VKRPPDDWQLELLCNLAAAELLMPIGVFPDLDQRTTDVERVLELRRKFEVSTEAVLIRIAKLSRRPLAVFAASRTDGSRLESQLRIEYLRSSRVWRPHLAPGRRLPSDTALSAVTAIGFTAAGSEAWPGGLEQVRVEGIGLPPYPGQRAPRVAGLIHPHGRRTSTHAGKIEYVRGDATKPREHGPRLVAHVVNDRTPNWGGQFARALRARYPTAQEQSRLGQQTADFTWVQPISSRWSHNCGWRAWLHRQGMGPQRVRESVTSRCVNVSLPSPMPRASSMHTCICHGSVLGRQAGVGL
jgi:hypothetical protein